MAFIANVGDSRAYLVREGSIHLLTIDHTQRKMLTRTLGRPSDITVDLFTLPIEEGDMLLLCTDGLSDLVSSDEMLDIVSQYVPQESVYHLVERANENGGTDNITAIVVRVLEIGS